MTTLTWGAYVGTFAAGFAAASLLWILALAAVARRERELRALARRWAVQQADQQVAARSEPACPWCTP